MKRIGRLLLVAVLGVPVGVPVGVRAEAPSVELEKRIEEFQLPVPGEKKAERSGVGATAMPSTQRSDEEIRRTTDWSKRSRELLRSLRPLAGRLAPSVGEVRVNGREVALATVVREDGVLVTKASELEGAAIGSITVRVGGSPVALPAKLLGVSESNDLAVLRVEQQGLIAVRWVSEGGRGGRGGTGGASEGVRVGEIVFAPDGAGNAVAMGVVSVGRRGTSGGKLGVGLSETDEGIVVGTVLPGSPAERAGVRSGDVLLAINDQEFADLDDLRTFLQLQSAGTEVAVTVLRKVNETEETLVLRATLGQLEGDAGTRPSGTGGPGGGGAGGRSFFQDTLGGPLSRRRTNFPAVYQHDAVVQPVQQGGPLVNLQGRAVGVNIARSGRVETLALPGDVVEAVVNEVLQEAGQGGPSTVPAGK